jgi:hypothetical protein
MPASASIVEAAQRMRDNSIGNILVEKDGKDPRSTDLESICSKEVVTLSPDQSEEDATH